MLTTFFGVIDIFLTDFSNETVFNNLLRIRFPIYFPI
jgi:hypothetical protein